ncbi:carbon-nitrogen hydrolase family protein [Patulibacter defluvii]|uniref:carbon-nitrogen hydrolase family protein n=1 Tax=Patulibacter defluvii TaxID=3095358 RepID=UPI002A764C00|nr:carbon-nitrogen hydrolase family protein [Patulibacter sp. DM4]
MSGQLRLAIAQARPRWLDRAATTAQALELMRRAAADGAQAIVFPETFLPGYPIWVCRTDGARFDADDQKRAYDAYLEAAVEADGPELREIEALARELGLFAYLGMAERGCGDARGTVFCSLAAIDPARGATTVHRKLLPTYDERLVWGRGDGFGLRAHDVGGARLGGLCCWENWMPQARQALYADGTDVLVGVWPGNRSLTADITRFVALEGRVWSVAASALLDSSDVPEDFPLHAALTANGPERYFDGGSAVADPRGAWLVEPLVGEERLIVVDLDLAAARRERLLFDPTGHYARPDVFGATVDRRRLRAARFVDEEPAR